MTIDSITNGYVIDHIKAGNAMKICQALGLDELTCPVAIIRNVTSSKMGKKDIIKIDEFIELNMDVLGYLDPEVTINIVKNGCIVEKKKLSLPDEIRDVIKCTNPRCITSVEPSLVHIFHLRDKEHRVYRCAYCEAAKTDTNSGL